MSRPGEEGHKTHKLAMTQCTLGFDLWQVCKEKEITSSNRTSNSLDNNIIFMCSSCGFSHQRAASEAMNICVCLLHR